MSWIKFDTTTPDKPEVWQIAAILDIDPDAVVGKLLRVWAWFDTHSEDGNAPIVTKVTLDRHVSNAGFCDAMVRTGWMTEDGESIMLSNFDRHNGQTSKNRALTAQRVANHKKKTNANANAQVTTNALPKEDKIREEKKDQKISPSDLSSAGAEDANRPAEPVPYQSIVDLYNEICGDMFPEALKTTDARRKAIRARWNFDTKNEREKNRTNSLDYWRRYFACCLNIEFFRKAAAGEHRGEHAGWVPGFDYLMRETTLLGVLEGKLK